MWTVDVTWPDGSTEQFADVKRHETRRSTLAYAYSYEVDSGNNVLRIYRQMFEQFGNNWVENESFPPEEVAYFRPNQWERVRGN